MSPIFMIGTQRSGSNLLRLMINQLSEIASPHPPHILDRMLPLVDLYGDLNNNENFSLLIDDVCRLVELNPVIWDKMAFDRKLVLSRSSKRSLLDIYETLHNIYTEKQGAETWCCKSLANINYIENIEAHFENPKYIYLYRDGRDVALSFQKAVVGDKHIYNIAKNWTDTQALALKYKATIGNARFFSISYEKLTQKPEQSANALCEFLGVKYVPEMLDFHKTNEAKNAAKSSALWGNVTQPIIKNNSNKFLLEMPLEDISIFESVAGSILDNLGYDRSCIAKGEEEQYSPEDIENFNEQNRRKILQQLLCVDKNDIQRRAQQTELLDQIKVRFAA